MRLQWWSAVVSSPTRPAAETERSLESRGDPETHHRSPDRMQLLVDRDEVLSGMGLLAKRWAAKKKGRGSPIFARLPSASPSVVRRLGGTLRVISALGKRFTRLGDRDIPAGGPMDTPALHHESVPERGCVEPSETSRRNATEPRYVFLSRVDSEKAFTVFGAIHEPMPARLP